MIEKKKVCNNNNIYDFRIINGIECKRRKGNNNWRRICKIKNCLSIAKGKNILCITHGGGYICRIKNCENISRHSFNYCDIHKHLYLCKKNSEKKIKKNSEKKNEKKFRKKNQKKFRKKNQKKFIR